MMREAAVDDDDDDGTGQGAGADTVGKVEGDTEGEGKSGGVIDVAAVVSEGRWRRRQLCLPSWECC